MTKENEAAPRGTNETSTGTSIDTELTQARSPDVPARKFPRTIHLGWGHTYFVRHGDAIKIGHSAIPKQRIRDIQTGFPVPLEILAIVPNTIISEPDAHQMFAHLRMSGEWFLAEPDLLAFIEKVKRDADQLPKRELPELKRADIRGLRFHLFRWRPHCPVESRQFISNLIEQMGNYQNNRDALRPLILHSITEIERRI